MKFNLKNRPTLKHEGAVSVDGSQEYGLILDKKELGTFLLNLSQWFEGFEKELRQKMENYVKEKPSFSSPQHEATVTILEILGCVEPEKP